MTFSDRDFVKLLGAVGHAFFGNFQALREVQRKCLPPVWDGQDVLVTSATASGKTEAVLAPLVARIRSNHSKNQLNPKILALAPTRALVNDLHTRVEGPLNELSWRCGRQTSDHREKASRPELLITTPESFDSMLVRNAERRDGVLKGHLLAGVEAVFIDEAHLFQASPRGAQVVWLLGRLRRLKSYAAQKGWTDKSSIQTVAASATVARSLEFAKGLLGGSAEVVQVPGNREIEIVCDSDGLRWVRLDKLAGVDGIWGKMLLTKGRNDVASVARLVWNTIKKGAKTDIRKILIFVPSRALCDQLSLELSDYLKVRRGIYVGAHHGSLERSLRENAERNFSTSRDAVLVATTTLEVGIDIGDVDVVGVVGAPPNTASLLQRIGRSGRRKGCVRLLPIVSSAMEAYAFASMLEAASQGALDPVPDARLWSVFIQQAASHVAQAGRKGRLKSDLLELAQDVWPENGGPATAKRILEHLIETEELVQKGNYLHLGEVWSDRLERSGGDFHHNFESGNQGTPVVDATTGEVLSHVIGGMAKSGGVALAGQRWEVVAQSGEIIIKSVEKTKGEQPFQYAVRGAPTGKNYAEHVRRGLGFRETDAPLLATDSALLWFHFGGSAYETVLLELIQGLGRVQGLFGLALKGQVTQDTISKISENREVVYTRIHKLADDVVSALSLGRHHRSLPAEVRSAVAVEAFGSDEFCDWIATRTVFTIGETHEAGRKLRIALGS